MAKRRASRELSNLETDVSRPYFAPPSGARIKRSSFAASLAPPRAASPAAPATAESPAPKALPVPKVKRGPKAKAVKAPELLVPSPPTSAADAAAIIAEAAAAVAAAAAATGVLPAPSPPVRSRAELELQRLATDVSSPYYAAPTGPRTSRPPSGSKPLTAAAAARATHPKGRRGSSSAGAAPGASAAAAPADAASASADAPALGASGSAAAAPTPRKGRGRAPKAPAAAPAPVAAVEEEAAAVEGGEEEEEEEAGAPAIAPVAAPAPAPKAGKVGRAKGASAAAASAAAAAAPPSSSLGAPSAPIIRRDVSARFSESVVYNGVVYLAGQVPEQTRFQGIKTQTKEVLDAVDAQLAAAGSHKGRLLSATCYLADLADLGGFNETWERWVPAGAAPARATIGAPLVDPSWRVEVVVTAALGQ